MKPLAGLLGVAADDAVFLDVNSLKPGDRWEDKILSAVKQSSVFILCWCCDGEKSTFISKEISTALADEQKRLVPVRLCPADLPTTVADRQWIDLRGRVLHQCSTDHHLSQAGAPYAQPSAGAAPTAPPAPEPPQRRDTRISGTGRSSAKRLKRAPLWTTLLPIALLVCFIGVPGALAEPLRFNLTAVGLVVAIGLAIALSYQFLWGELRERFSPQEWLQRLLMRRRRDEAESVERRARQYFEDLRQT